MGPQLRVNTVRLPHQEDFPYRARVFAWAVCVMALAGILWPGQSLPARLTDLGYALISVVGPYIVVRFVFFVIMELAGDSLPRLLFAYLVILFYAGILATILGLIALPFQWSELDGRHGVTGPMYLASLPSGLAASAAALSVIRRHYVDG